MSARKKAVIQMEPLAVSPKEATKLAGLGGSDIYDAIKARELPAFEPVVNRRLVMVTELKQWLADYQVGYCSEGVGSKVDGVEPRYRTHESTTRRGIRKAAREERRKDWYAMKAQVQAELNAQTERQLKGILR
jgi:hypothetical protein